MGYFQDLGSDLHLVAAPAGPDGLRDAQRGALMALAAHTTVSREPAQLVLPTGVGKTLVATLAPYVLQAKRVLVVVPGKLIRSQLAAGFRDPARAIAAGVLPEATRGPDVAVASHRATEEDWRSWLEADVVIGTPAVLSPAYEAVSRMPTDMFDLVIFDEAHHLPASTWTAMLGASDGQAVLLTATPFRNDGKRLPGRVVYSYPLATAIEHGVYGEVRYLPVSEIDGEDLDLTIARTAAERLRAPEHVAAGSRLIVRSDSVSHAEHLEALYQSVGVPLGTVVHTTSWKRAQEMRTQVEQGTLDGFVCVGALTEGFDFPALKIGAYHVPHKTLGPTLQFIGRLSRAAEIPGELIAPRSAVTEETASLYREDVGWRKLLPALLDSAVDHERNVRTFIQESRVSGPLDLAPLSFTPPRSVHIFVTGTGPNLGTAPPRLGDAPVVQSILHTESQTAAFVTERIHRPRFMRLDLLDASIFELHLVTWVEQPGLLFLSTTTDPALRDLTATVAPGHLRQLSATELRRLLDAANFQRFFSIGIRSARAQSTTSYRMRAGPKTEEDLTAADARGWDLGHGMGRSGSGTFGFSVAKSKIWEPGSADSLYAFRAWCEDLADAIARPPVQRASTKLDLFAISEPLERFPDSPLVAVFSSRIYNDGIEIAIDGELFVPELLELWAQGAASGPNSVLLSLVVAGETRAAIECHLDGTVSVSGATLLVRRPSEPNMALEDYLEQMPLTVFFASGTRVTGTRVAATPPRLVPLAPSVPLPRSWLDIDITAEFDTPEAGMRNIGEATAALLAADMPIVIQDHSKGELADFVAIDNRTLLPEVRLVHCKASGSSTPAARVTDLEELVAQAIRSVQWLSPSADLWVELRRRVDTRQATKILHGSREEIVAQLDEWSTTPPVATWSLWLVQPGTSIAALDGAPNATSLLNAAHAWIAGESVDLRLLCSE